MSAVMEIVLRCVMAPDKMNDCRIELEPRIASGQRRPSVDRQHNSNASRRRRKRPEGRRPPMSVNHTKTDKWVTNGLSSSGKFGSADRKRNRSGVQVRSDLAQADRFAAGRQVVADAVGADHR